MAVADTESEGEDTRNQMANPNPNKSQPFRVVCFLRFAGDAAAGAIMGSIFQIWHSYSEASKQDNLSDDDLGSNLCTGDPDCGLSTTTVYAQESRIMKCSLNEATVDPPDECLALTSRLPEPHQYGCSSPDHNIKPCYGVKLYLKLDIGCMDDKKKIFFADKTMPAKKVTETTKEEVPESDWENVYNVADDLLHFDDSTESEACEGQDARLGDKETSEQRQPGSPFGPYLEKLSMIQQLIILKMPLREMKPIRFRA